MIDTALICRFSKAGTTRRSRTAADQQTIFAAIHKYRPDIPLEISYLTKIPQA